MIGVIGNGWYSGMAFHMQIHLLIVKEENMIKIRLQGTTKEIKWFFKILDRDKRFILYDPSETFDIKGSQKYKRAYAMLFRDEAELREYKTSLAEKENKTKNKTRYYDSGVVFGTNKKKII